MVAIGLILLVLAILVAVGIALSNTGEVDVELLGEAITGLTTGTLFLAGVATGVVGMLGLSLMLAGLKRRRTKAQEHKRQVHSARSDADTLAEENARLQDELQRKQAANKADAYPTSSGDRAGQSGRHAPGHPGSE